MSDDNMIRVTKADDGNLVQVLPDGSTRPIEDRTDWARLEAMTDEEIEATASSDADNPPLTDEELSGARPRDDEKRFATGSFVGLRTSSGDPSTSSG